MKTMVISMETINMTSLFPTPGTGKFKRHSPASAHLDMTPMVDLGFLLITFFIFTTTLAQKGVVKLVMPHKGDGTDVAESKALTAILGKDNKVFIYSGKWEDVAIHQKVVQTSYNVNTGMGSWIRAKQNALGKHKNSMVFIIKPTEHASYQNVVDA